MQDGMSPDLFDVLSVDTMIEILIAHCASFMTPFKDEKKIASLNLIII